MPSKYTDEIENSGLHFLVLMKINASFFVHKKDILLCPVVYVKGDGKM